MGLFPKTYCIFSKLVEVFRLLKVYSKFVVGRLIQYNTIDCSKDKDMLSSRHTLPKRVSALIYSTPRSGRVGTIGFPLEDTPWVKALDDNLSDHFYLSQNICLCNHISFRHHVYFCCKLCFCNLGRLCRFRCLSLSWDISIASAPGLGSTASSATASCASPLASASAVASFRACAFSVVRVLKNLIAALVPAITFSLRYMQANATSMLLAMILNYAMASDGCGESDEDEDPI